MKLAKWSGLAVLSMFIAAGCGGPVRSARSLPLGAEPPEVTAADWINADGPQTLAALRGQVVLVECWATWCGPCVAGIPHMNAMQKKFGSDGLQILSFTNEDRATVEGFQKMTRSPIEYTIGVGSDTDRKYGVRGIPHAFLIGRNGKLLWEGHPAEPDCEAKIEAALAKKMEEGGTKNEDRG